VKPSTAGAQQVVTVCGFGCLSVVANYVAFMTFYPACLALVLEVTLILAHYKQCIQRHKYMHFLFWVFLLFHRFKYWPQFDKNPNLALVLFKSCNQPTFFWCKTTFVPKMLLHELFILQMLCFLKIEKLQPVVT